GEEGRMVTLRLSEGANPVSEGQRVGEVREVEDPFESSNPIALQHLPPRDLTSKLCDLRRGHPGRVVAAGDTPFGGQRAHRAASRFLLAGKLRPPDAFFGDLYTLDALEAEEQF